MKSARLHLDDVHALRRLAVPGESDRLVADVRVKIAFWEAPLPRWRGRLGPLRTVRSVTLDFDPEAQTAGARVTLTEPTPLALVASALIPAFTPDAPLEGAGFPLLAVDPTAGPDVLALLPSRRVPGIEPIVPALAGEHLRRADVVLTGDAPAEVDPGASVGIGPGEADEAEHQDPPATWRLPVSDAARGRPRVELPVIDLNVHNPIGRIVSFAASPQPRVMRVAEDRRTVHVETQDGGRRLSFPADRPLAPTTVRGLRDVESIDLSELGWSVPSVLFARFAEIAATGAILHGLPDEVRIGDHELSPRIAAAIRRPYRQRKGLERELRSVELRRAAMHDHGGFLRLASAVEELTGYRVLPRVSVILSTMRPDLVPGVLEMMAKQTYPDFEVVVVLHGVPAPSLEGADLGRLPYTIVEVPGDRLFGAALAEGVRRSSGDLITKLDDDDWYSEHHIFDLVLAHLYSRADIVGKTTEYLYFEEVEQTVHRTFATERYHDQVAGGAMLMSRAAFDALGGWRPTPNSTDRSVLIRVETQGGIAYRTHGLGYMYIRHSSTHTWRRTDSQLLKGSFEQWRGWRTPEVDA